MPGVFISYSHKDEQFAGRIAQSLEARGFGIWFAPRKLYVGDELKREIKKAVDEVDVFLLVSSPSALQSDWVRLELNLARQKEQSSHSNFILEAKYQPCDPPEDYSFLKLRLWADFLDEKNFDKAIGQLIVAINATTRHRKLHTSYLPPNAGHISGYKAPSGRQIFFIQLAPTNYSAEKATAEITRYIVRHWPTRLILIEGGTGDVSLRHMRKLASGEVRRKVAEDNLRKGLISGVEYLDLTSDDDPLIMQGIDNTEMYNRTSAAFLKAAQVKREMAETCEIVVRDFTEFQKAALNETLWHLEKAADDFHAGENTLIGLRQLRDIATGNGVRMNSYPNVNDYLMISDLSTQLAEPERIRIEQKHAISLLRPLATDDELGRLNSVAGGVREGTKGQAEFFLELGGLLTAYTLWQESLERLRGWCRYYELDRQVNVAMLREEVIRLTNSLHYRLAKTHDERQTIQAAKIIGAMLKAVQVKLDPVAYEIFKEHQLSLGWLSKFIATIAQDKNLQFDLSALERLINASEISVAYYDCVSERAVVIAQNAIEAMNNNNETYAVLVASGFLFPYISKYLLAAGEVVIPIVPRVDTPTDEKQFEQIIRRQGEPWQPLTDLERRLFPKRATD